MTDNPVVCLRCGKAHERCTAHNRAGGPCRQHPVVGLRVCHLHGGKTPRAVAKVERLKTEAAARAAAARFGIHADTDAHRELARLINISAGLVGFYEWQCMALAPDALVFGDTEVREDWRGTTLVQRAEASVWLRLYAEERRELRALCQAAITAGLAEREVRLAEKHGALVAEVLRRALAELELSPEQQTRALTVVPQLLREVGQDGPESR